MSPSSCLDRRPGGARAGEDVPLRPVRRGQGTNCDRYDRPGRIERAAMAAATAARASSLRSTCCRPPPRVFGMGTGAARQEKRRPETEHQGRDTRQAQRPQGKTVIMIDPGHGGIDGGAVGVHTSAREERRARCRQGAAQGPVCERPLRRAHDAHLRCLHFARSAPRGLAEGGRRALHLAARGFARRRRATHSRSAAPPSTRFPSAPPTSRPA